MTASIEQPDPASGLGYWPAFWALGSPTASNYTAANSVGTEPGGASPLRQEFGPVQ
jgi:hypothetical protein